MKINANINVPHLSRVEGHGNIKISIKDGNLVDARWEVVETPRFFEAILAGRDYQSAPYISGRICGICSIGHTLASIRAVENAFGFVPSAQTTRLRLLLKHMETLQSHVLHLYFLVAPDFLGQGSVLPLIESAPDVVKRAAGLKLLANDAADLIGGRRLHPTTTIVGGFTKMPDRMALGVISQRLKDSMDGLMATVELFKTFRIPDFTRETEFVSLKGVDAYPFIGGGLVSSDGVLKNEDQYLDMTNEYMTGQSTAKWCRLSRESFAVGALARLNNNFALLDPAARQAAETLGLRPVNHNPFMNNVAQLVECIHVVHESIYLIDSLLSSPWEAPQEDLSPRAGAGVGAVEVPRGILYHSYEIDDSGRISKANCVIPTGQNHANIQHDLAALAQKYAALNTPDNEIELLASMLVRAYDPCISCSVH